MSLREGHGLDGFRAPSLVFWTLLSELGKNVDSVREQKENR